jgi:NitT/TauT family transport system permease protein
MKKLINQQPSSGLRLALGLLPFALLLLIYLSASDARLAENPNDKLLPSLSAFGHAIKGFAIEPNARTGEILLWADTLSSLRRLGLGLGISALCGLFFGVLMGSIPLARAGLSPLVRAISLIPPMAILPVLFIVFGLDELSKVVLIVIGIAPLIMRDLQQRVQEIPSEQLIKAQTLGGNSWQIILRVILPQVLPRLIDAVRLQLGCAWLFLISAEAIAATDGLGYRIFLVRRYMSMDIILPYVLWITMLAYVTDWLLRRLSSWAFPWFDSNKADA